jgi:hypothetical protein
LLSAVTRPQCAPEGATTATPAEPSGRLPNQYPNDPVGYAYDQLGITFTEDQAAIARALREPPHRVRVVSANTTGQIILVGCLINRYFDNHGPGITIRSRPTTALG